MGGGGAQNILSSTKARIKGQAGSINTSGKYYNAPKNIPHIETVGIRIQTAWQVRRGLQKRARHILTSLTGPLQCRPTSPPSPPAPSSPTHPWKPLRVPIVLRSFDMGTLAPAEPMAARDKFLSPDMSQGFPGSIKRTRSLSMQTEVSLLSRKTPMFPDQGGPAHPNLLDSPSSSRLPLPSTKAATPQVIAQPTRPGGKNQVKAAQAQECPLLLPSGQAQFPGKGL